MTETDAIRAASGASTALVSIHDVMPETLGQVESILSRLRSCGVSPVTLLVVPGRAWTSRQLTTLQTWAEYGHELAAHGWQHHVAHIRGWRHRLHAAVISRQVAEHLALEKSGILRLLQASHDWFARHDLPVPSLYVPPAWALGSVDAKDLQATPFAQIEVLRGLHLPPRHTFEPLPLVGFEVDSSWRKQAVRTWNRWQQRQARATGRPLRIAIHPNDFELPLAADLDTILQEQLKFVAYTDLCP